MYVVFVGVISPNDSKLSRRVELFNECGLQFTTYHLALFPLAPTTADEELAGWSMIGTVGIVFVVNLGLMVVMTLSGLKRKCYLKKIKKTHDTAVAKMKLERLQKLAAFRMFGPQKPELNPSKESIIALQQQNAIRLDSISEDDSSEEED